MYRHLDCSNHKTIDKEIIKIILYSIRVKLWKLYNEIAWHAAH